MNEWEDQAWEDLPARIDQLQAELFQSEQVKDNSRPFTHVSLRVVYSTCTICDPSTSCVKSWPFIKSSKKKKKKDKVSIYAFLKTVLANSLFSQWLLFSSSLKSANPWKRDLVICNSSHGHATWRTVIMFFILYSFVISCIFRCFARLWWYANKINSGLSYRTSSKFKWLNISNISGSFCIILNGKSVT